MSAIEIPELLTGRHMPSGELYFCSLKPFILYKEAGEADSEDYIELKTNDWKRYTSLTASMRREYDAKLLSAIEESYPSFETFFPISISLAKLCNYPDFLIFRNKDFTEFYAAIPEEEGENFIEKLDPYANPSEVLTKYKSSGAFNLNYRCVKYFYENIRNFFEIELKSNAPFKDIPLPPKYPEQSRNKDFDYPSI